MLKKVPQTVESGLNKLWVNHLDHQIF